MKLQIPTRRVIAAAQKPAVGSAGLSLQVTLSPSRTAKPTHPHTFSSSWGQGGICGQLGGYKKIDDWYPNSVSETPCLGYSECDGVDASEATPSIKLITTNGRISKHHGERDALELNLEALELIHPCVLPIGPLIVVPSLLCLILIKKHSHAPSCAWLVSCLSTSLPLVVLPLRLHHPLLLLQRQH